ncbi:MAG: inositol monophosphatase family protein, partial [Candidatus Hydrogenedens sp.]
VPITGDVFIAKKGKGAWRNGQRIEVSTKKELDESCVLLDFGRKSSRKERLPFFINPLLHFGQVRCIGSAILAIIQVAMGIADAYVHASLQPWDFLAGKLILEEAHGKITQKDGTPIHLFSKNDGIIATNGYIHDELLKILEETSN